MLAMPARNTYTPTLTQLMRTHSTPAQCSHLSPAETSARPDDSRLCLSSIVPLGTQSKNGFLRWTIEKLTLDLSLCPWLWYPRPLIYIQQPGLCTCRAQRRDPQGSLTPGKVESGSGLPEALWAMARFYCFISFQR